MRVHSMTRVLCFAGALAAAACGGKVEAEGTGTGGASGTGGGASTGTGTGTSTSTSSSSSTSSGSTSGGAPLGDCKTAADCGGNPCVPVTPGGYTVCEATPPEATMCTLPPGGPGSDQCCTSADCKTGKCYLSTSLPQCGGPAMQVSNLCLSDTCSNDAACGNGSVPQICTPAGAFGFPTRQCLVAYCHTDADCGAQAGGHCAVVSAPCCTSPAGLACVYPGGCRKDTDCANDGSKHCQIDPASKSGVCIAGPAACPV